MECNKDEAIRAKELARKKMQDNDFVGARKIALKAQQLFPELENISHLLAVCHVHCSDKDWYSILQVTKLADEATIKKQYRRLALLLHPDKNNFPGAEAAFKLIGEANVVLSDRGKRSLYDSKLGISIKSGQAKPPTQQGNKNPSTRKPHVFQNNTANGFSNQSSGPNRATPSNPSVSQESFWTCCPFCNIKYQYYRDFVNRALRCPKCSKPFIAYDIAAQGVPPKASPGQAATPGMPPKAGPSRAATQVVPPGTNESQAAAPGVPPRTNQSRAATQGVPPRPNVSQPPSSRQEEKPVQGSHGAVKKETVDFPASGSGSQGVGLDSGTQMRNAHVVGSDLKTQKSTKSAGSRSQGVATPRTDKTKREDTNLKDKKRKGVKLEAESSESYDSSCSRDSEDMIIEDSVSDIAADQKSGVNDIYERRRSSRQKHQVTYMESEGEDGDLESPLKRPREGKSSNEKGQQEGLVEDDPQCYTPSKQKRRIDPPTEANMNPATELADGAPENGAKSVKIDDSESDVSSPVVFNCPEPEFNDFDKDKAQSCFAIDQFWACYGNEDGMPRYYAHIRKVYSTGFKLRVMWLEPDPDNEDEIEWVDTELPVGSGKYRRGEYQDITDQFTFSHRIICEKGKKGFFFVYPRKGETWALFKDWNIKWSTEPEKHASYKFEIVEVLTDFVEGVGIRAVLLDKVRGFISLFYHGSQNRTGEFVIPPIELYRFSHRIPFFKMTGTERKGVPEGSFELDPASLPANPDDICYPSMFKMDNKTLGTRGNSLLPELSPGRSKSKMSETLVTPKKTDQCNGRRVSDGEGSALRRSPRGVNTGYKENKQVNASCVSSQSVAANNLNGKEGRSCNAEVSSQQDDSSPRRSDSISSSVSPSHTVALEQFHDFKSDRLPGKFEVGQIWALYETDNNLPKMYGQIKKVGVAYCILHVALFESCSVSKNGIKPACGAFKLISGKPRTFGSSSFSHLLDAKMINQYRFDVYPKAGQVWALYKNWKAEFTSADLENCEYDIVEVTRNSDGLINVTSLVPLKGYKSVFRSSRKSISSIGSMDIPENEMTRFSHQIPAFLLSTERGRALGGCWEVDPVSLLGKETCKKEFESSVKALSLRVEKIEAKEKEIEAMDMRLVSKMEEFAGKEKEFDSKAVETRKKEENLERCRENLESKEKDLCLRTEKLEGKDKEIKAREIDLDSRKKELVVKGDDLERKGVEFRKQSENLETCKKKFEFMENDLSLRTGRLAAKEKQVEAREMVLSSREAELIVKQNADEKNAVEIRKKSENLEACRKEFESKEKEFEARKMFLNSRTEELESKADEIRKKEENLERCRKNLESKEKDLCLRKERLEGKNKGIKAREIDLDSRKKELVVKGDDLKRKGVEFRKQSENLETCKRKFEFEENDLSVRTGRLAAKEKQVEAREMVFSSRVAELIVKQNEIEKNAVEIRKKAENLHTCRKEFESKEKEFEARRMVLDSRTEELESKADEIRKKEENLERCRENLESKEKDVCLRKEKLEGKDKGIKAREIDLDSRKKELVVKEDDLERKGVEFRKQSENLETCKKKFEFEENDLSLRIGRLAAKEKQVEAREMVFSSREAKLIVKQNEIEKNAVDIRKKSENVETCWKEFESKEKDLSLRTKKLGAKEKEIEGREMDLDSMMEELERKADEIRKKEEFLERCRTKIEYTKQALLLRREELEAKDKGIEAREVGSVSRMKELRAKEEELALRERYLNMKLNERNESANSVDDKERACKLPKLDSADPRKRLEFRSKGKKRSRVCKDIDIVPIAPKEGTVCTNLAEMSLDKSKMHYSDPEFHDFDKGRKKSCLAVDQFWACYDQADAMPRFYMQIKKVYSKKFKVQITWLEVNPQYRCEVDAFVKDLPVACGKFISRNSEVILDPHTLSHQIHCEEDRNKGFYVIYPRKGEIWALYKDLHIKKKSNYEYEIVVVLSDFVEPTGIRVAYLNKLEGYVSLFQREKGSTSFLIRPNNLFKFSHQIPSYPLDGTESEGIPDGCFELDPACLPPECDGTSPPLVKTEQQQC